MIIVYDQDLFNLLCFYDNLASNLGFLFYLLQILRRSEESFCFSNGRSFFLIQQDACP